MDVSTDITVTIRLTNDERVMLHEFLCAAEYDVANRELVRFVAALAERINPTLSPSASIRGYNA